MVGVLLQTIQMRWICGIPEVDNLDSRPPQDAHESRVFSCKPPPVRYGTEEKTPLKLHFLAIAPGSAT